MQRQSTELSRYSLRATGSPSRATTLSIQSSVDLSSWMLKGFIPTSDLNSEMILFLQKPRQSVRPQVDPRSRWFTIHLGRIYVPNPAISTRSSYSHDHPLAVISVRRRPYIKSVCNTMCPDFSLCQRLLQIVHHLFPCQPVRHKLWTSQATSDSQEALEFHIHVFHREAPSIFRLHLNSSHC